MACGLVLFLVVACPLFVLRSGFPLSLGGFCPGFFALSCSSASIVLLVVPLALLLVGCLAGLVPVLVGAVFPCPLCPLCCRRSSAGVFAPLLSLVALVRFSFGGFGFGGGCEPPPVNNERR